jgi:hypothetical protein
MPISTSGAKPAIPRPGWEQPSDRRCGLIPSVRQSRYRRGSAWRQPHGSRFLIQVSEYLPDHCRIFNTGDYFARTATLTAITSLLEGPLLAYSVEKLVCEMSDFATLILIRGLCSS